VKTLEESLLELESLLRSRHAFWWADKIRRVLDPDALFADRAAEVRSWFGGMGSLNDLWLSRGNGHRIDDGEEDKVNRRLQQLRGEVYRLVDAVLRSDDRRGV
jgi:Domain of unknown function (DUF6966)